MKKIYHITTILLIILVCFSCSRDNVNEAPGDIESILFPTPNLLCTDSTITFDWSDAPDTDGDIVSYEIVISKNRELTNVIVNQTVATSQVTITLEKGTAYYWTVTPIDSQNNRGTPTEVYAFYTSGDGLANSVPFTAELLEPDNQGNVNSGLISLSWIGADADAADTLSYDLFFGESSDPPVLEVGLSEQFYNVTVDSGKTYYWKVNTLDSSGGKSIGIIWSFTVN